MKRLRTLSLRTIPPIPAAYWQEHHGTFHQELVDLVLQALNVNEPRDRPPLATLALGSLTYRDICKGHVGEDSETKDVQDYLCPTVYKVNPITWTAAFTEKGSYERTEADGGSVRVLKPYWLG